MAFVKEGTQFDRKTGKWTELFECEVESDLSELPACNPMSRCYVYETKKFYAVNKFGQWGPAAEADLPAVSTVQLDAVVHSISRVEWGIPDINFYVLKDLIDDGTNVVIRAEINDVGILCMHLAQINDTELKWTQIRIDAESYAYLHQLTVRPNSVEYKVFLPQGSQPS